MPSGQHRPAHRKAKNIAADPRVVIGTEKADEAVILEGLGEKSKTAPSGNNSRKSTTPSTGGDVEPLLMSSEGCVFRVKPQVAFGQDEHAENFADLSPVGIFRIVPDPGAANLVLHAN